MAIFKERYDNKNDWLLFMVNRPEAITMEAVKLKWSYRICSGAIIARISQESVLSGHLPLFCLQSGNNVIPLWNITIFILTHNK